MAVQDIFSTVRGMFGGGGTPAGAPVSPMGMNNPGAAVVPPAGASNPTAPAAAEKPANPLDAFSSLWQTSKDDPAPHVDPFSTPLFKQDANAIDASAGKIDFIATMPADLKVKFAEGIKAGDVDAVFSAINYVGQRALAASAHLSTATVEAGAKQTAQRLRSEIPRTIKQVQLDTTNPGNTALQHPSAKPLMDMAKAAVQAKNPNMPAAEVTKQAENYLATFAQAVAPAAAPATPRGGETDWDIWASS